MTTSHTHVDSLSDVNPDPERPDRMFTAFCAVREVVLGTTRDGKPFATVRVYDVTRALSGKVWRDAPNRALEEVRAVEPGTALKILFAVSVFQGRTELSVKGIRPAEDEPGFEPEHVFGTGYELVEGLELETLVFDIETVPDTDLRKVPTTIAQSVAKAAERGDGDPSKVMSLSPWFGKVVSLAVGDGELEHEDESKITTFIVPPPGREQDEFPPWMRPVTETELLQAFWCLAQRADLVVTYNGRGFDVPYLVSRSLVHDIPARVDLMSRGLRPHLDLFRVANPGFGRGPASLDVVCWALGLSSPKGEMDGSMVAPTYDRGDIESIAEYNRGDVRATAGVYRRIRERVLQFRDDW